jgi:hypothetical protein
VRQVRGIAGAGWSAFDGAAFAGKTVRPLVWPWAATLAAQSRRAAYQAMALRDSKPMRKHSKGRDQRATDSPPTPPRSVTKLPSPTQRIAANIAKRPAIAGRFSFQFNSY